MKSNHGTHWPSSASFNALFRAPDGPWLRSTGPDQSRQGQPLVASVVAGWLMVLYESDQLSSAGD
jgi:hypothetical protein